MKREIIGFLTLLIGLSYSFSSFASPKPLSGIQMYNALGKKQELSAKKLGLISEDIHVKQRSFADQRMVPIAKLLKSSGIEHGKTVVFSDQEGKTAQFELKGLIENKPALALISTNHGKWKLISTKGRKKTPHHFYLRSVAKISVFNDQVPSSTTKSSRSTCQNTKVYSNLTEALNEKDSVCFVNLGGQNLKRLPPELFELKHVRELYLGRNRLTKLPKKIGQMQELEKLVVGRNRLKTLPSEIGQLNNLKILKLGRNKITSIPPEIGQLGRLTKLELDNNRLQKIPSEVGNMEQLEELELAYNPIRELPSSLKQLKNLEKVELSDQKLTPEEKEKIATMLKGVEIEYE